MEHFEDSPFPAPLHQQPIHKYCHRRRIHSAQIYRFVLRSALSPDIPGAPPVIDQGSPSSEQPEGPH